MKDVFDYSELRGKIKARFNTQSDFAKAMGFSDATLSAKLNNLSEFSQGEIKKATELLNTDISDISAIFFTPLVQKN